jgi:hypothetical protein
MIRLVLIIFISFVSLSAVSQDAVNKPITSDSLLVAEEPSIIIKDKISKDVPKEDVKANNDFDWQKNMPWVGAVLIGLLTVLANYIISRESRKSNIEISKIEMENSKEIALEQIENAREGMQLEFNKTVLSGNRQIWIKEFRELVSLILSKTIATSINNDISEEEFENFKFLLIKAELMLNPLNDKAVIKALSELEECCLEVLMSNKEPQEIEKYASALKDKTKIKLEEEWGKVKRAE